MCDENSTPIHGHPEGANKLLQGGAHRIAAVEALECPTMLRNGWLRILVPGSTPGTVSKSNAASAEETSAAGDEYLHADS